MYEYEYGGIKMLLILSGPSAVGKTTIGELLIERGVLTRMLRSVTTRSPRGETDTEYDFVSVDEFKKLKLAESVCYSGNYYGLPMKELRRALSDDGISIVIAESQGMLEIKSHSGENCLAVFMDAPDSDLHRRLKLRGGNYQSRIDNIAYDRSRINMHDVVIFNPDGGLEKAAMLLTSLLKGWSSRGK